MKIAKSLALALTVLCAVAYAFQFKDITDVKTIAFAPVGPSAAEKKVDGMVRAELKQMGFAVSESGKADATLTLKLKVSKGAGGAATVDYDGLLEGADGFMIHFQLVGTHSAMTVEDAATLDGKEIAEVLKKNRAEHLANKKKGN
jgi:outer membrane lipopolysaccharide assembly protein LptE/RlpB